MGTATYLAIDYKTVQITQTVQQVNTVDIEALRAEIEQRNATIQQFTDQQKDLDAQKQVQQDEIAKKQAILDSIANVQLPPKPEETIQPEQPIIGDIDAIN